jgi:hypothetical protein
MTQKDTRMPRTGQWDKRGRYSTPQWAAIEPLTPVPFTPQQIMVKRLELAEEMLTLIVQDGVDLARTQRRTLTRITAMLSGLRRQARGVQE